MPTIAREGNNWAVRLDRGAVLLDSRRGRIVEVEERVAATLDLIVFDRIASLPTTDGEAALMRRALRALREELFDESLRPSVEMEKGETLLRRYVEPEQWRRPTRKRALHGAVLTIGLVRRHDGSAVALAGPPEIVASVTGALSDRGIATDDVVLFGRDGVFVRTANREYLRLVEVWTVEAGDRAGVTLMRLSSARALVKLLFAARVRPSETALAVLGLCAERVPHFTAVLPRDLASRAHAVTGYFSTVTP